ncbi:MAG: alpha-L-fucosidase, partial [Chloroflexi bacterium]|nr:alpha-L-fucosidase [Chloroflexota bacterium]
LALTQTATVSVTTVGSRAQASPNPIVFDQTATNDNLVVLMAAASEHSDSLSLLYSGPSVYPKHFWFANFKSPSQFMKWNVSLATGAVYRVYAKLSAGAILPLQLSVTGTNTSLNFTTRNIGWDKQDCGTISIPAGASQLVLRRNTTNSTAAISIISLELLRESDRPAYEQRVANSRADTTWFSKSKYGLMTQFGPWGYPPSGPQVPFETWVNGFNVTNFVNLVTNTGAKYVIWSLTWWTYQICAPIQSVDNILGNSNRTSTRDLIGELATALHAAGVRFMLYYHCGQDGHLGYNSTDWWQAQRFPASDHTGRGVGDRSVFLTNWCNVITEIGNRYGTNLDGWFFDDGMVYYPAPFERLGRAAKAGNRNRLVSYNAWIATSYTDFQEVWMGEGSHGESQFGSAPAGGNGIFIDGPQRGLLEQGMFIMEEDWGIHRANQPINTTISANQAIGWVQSASARGVPLSFNMMFWSDQTYSTNSLNVVRNLKKTLYGSTSAPTNNLVVNGGFESPTMPDWAPYPPGSTSLTGWTIDATPSDGVQLGRAGIFSANNGSQNLQLTGGSAYANGGAISQMIATAPGMVYAVSIDIASRNGSAVTGNFNFGSSNRMLNASSTSFTNPTWQVPAATSNTLIKIVGSPNSATKQLVIDSVMVQPVCPLKVAIQRHGTNTILSWPHGALQQAGSVGGPSTNVPGSTSPWTNKSPFGKERFFRLLW